MQRDCGTSNAHVLAGARHQAASTQWRVDCSAVHAILWRKTHSQAFKPPAAFRVHYVTCTSRCRGNLHTSSMATEQQGVHTQHAQHALCPRFHQVLQSMRLIAEASCLDMLSPYNS